MKQIGLIYGTRPELIKIVPLFKELSNSKEYNPILIATGQHQELLENLTLYFEVIPKFNFSVMSHEQTLNQLFAKVMNGFDACNFSTMLDAVIVQGDTTSATASALAGHYSTIPIFHLEAGLRSGDYKNPFPEESNRKIISQISSLHLAPTAANKENLVREGINSDTIFITGNTGIDALFSTRHKQTKESYCPQIFSELSEHSDPKLVLITLHRRESWGEQFDLILDAIKNIASEFPNFLLIFPMHQNPKLQSAIRFRLDGTPNIKLIEPLNYPDFVWAMSHSSLILTDSGGVQEEAPSLGVPTLVLRTTTERPEGIEAGSVILVGTNPEDIFKQAKLILDQISKGNYSQKISNPYGDGKAASNCINAINEFFRSTS